MNKALIKTFELLLTREGLVGALFAVGYVGLLFEHHRSITGQVELNSAIARSMQDRNELLGRLTIAIEVLADRD